MGNISKRKKIQFTAKLLLLPSALWDLARSSRCRGAPVFRITIFQLLNYSLNLTKVLKSNFTTAFFNSNNIFYLALHNFCNASSRDATFYLQEPIKLKDNSNSQDRRFIRAMTNDHTEYFTSINKFFITKRLKNIQEVLL